jgi:PAS domain-containing protein
VLDKNWFETFIPQEDRAAVAAVFREVLESGAWPRYENVILTKGGEERRIVWYNTMLLGPGGRGIGTMSIGDDITERRRAEEELQETMRNLEDFNRIAVGRELRMIELKEEINELGSRLGMEPKYETEDQPVEQERNP